MAEATGSVAAAAGRLLLLGCGKMGGAMLEGWLAAGLDPALCQVIEPQPADRLSALADQGLRLNPAAFSPPDVAVLAVKPQMMGDALPAVTSFGGGDTLFISIAAGTPIAAFEAAFGAGTPVVRAMPNTPAAVGRGISALIANMAAGEAGLTRAEALLSVVGQTVRLDTEAQMDAVTGLSGSGPAYVFHLIEAMAAAGEAEGLAPDLAMTLARATVTGAGALAAQSDESAAQLRINVTSPGGTTAAGLAVLMERLPDLMRGTVAAAAERSRDLAKG
ncbi:MAG: pyrroline-5-carboxylate reductase [Pseudomonadota bacterium]